MARSQYRDEIEARPFQDTPETHSRQSLDSVSSLSSTSVVLEHMNDHQDTEGNAGKVNPKTPLMHDEKYDAEGAGYKDEDERGPSKTVKVVLWAMCALCLAGWLLALFLFLKNGTSGTSLISTPSSSSLPSSSSEKPHSAPSKDNPKAVQFDEVLGRRLYRGSRVLVIRTV